MGEQVIVITGASSGIGLATAEAAAQAGAQAGAQLVLAARSVHTLEHLCVGFKARGVQAIAVNADVAERPQLERLADAAIARFGRIDTWVNNAGVSICGALQEVSDADSRRLFDVNFWGVVYGSLVALPHLKRQGGALINLGSEVSDAVLPLQGMYTASKHAVKGFTDVLRLEVQELEKAPVVTTLIQPSAVDTPFPEHARNYLAHEPQLPEPRIEPRRVAEAILEAACHGGRDVTVGALAALNVAVAKVTPALGDQLAARQAARQQRNEPPLHPEGTLYQPGESGPAASGRVHGAD